MADMVGHTGDLEATAEACTLVDSCVKELLDTVEQQGGRWLLTADHGNADDMVQRNKKDSQPIRDDDKPLPLTSHTLVSRMDCLLEPGFYRIHACSTSLVEMQQAIFP